MFVNKLRGRINQQIDNNLKIIYNGLAQVQINQGKYLGQQNLLYNKEIILNDIKKAEFKVFSQWGDDGIINFLINYLNITNKTFIEFGVENYKESNTRFLLINENWRGLIFDGSKENMDSVKNEDIYWKYDLTAVNAFITAENINELINNNSFSGEIGLLHIDIDGNDYWVWKSIQVINPIIVIVEYNAVFGLNPWVIPYDASFFRSDKHYSNLYFGASISAFCHLANNKGYSFIGCNSAGNNAYFIRNDNLKGLKVLTPENGFVNSMFKESRDNNGNLTYLKGNERLNAIKGMPVINIQTGQETHI